MDCEEFGAKMVSDGVVDDVFTEKFCAGWGNLGDLGQFWTRLEQVCWGLDGQRVVLDGEVKVWVDRLVVDQRKEARDLCVKALGRCLENDPDGKFLETFLLSGGVEIVLNHVVPRDRCVETILGLLRSLAKTADGLEALFSQPLLFPKFRSILGDMRKWTELEIILEIFQYLTHERNVFWDSSLGKNVDIFRQIFELVQQRPKLFLPFLSVLQRLLEVGEKSTIEGLDEIEIVEFFEFGISQNQSMKMTLTTLDVVECYLNRRKDLQGRDQFDEETIMNLESSLIWPLAALRYHDDEPIKEKASEILSQFPEFDV